MRFISEQGLNRSEAESVKVTYTLELFLRNLEISVDSGDEFRQ